MGPRTGQMNLGQNLQRGQTPASAVKRSAPGATRSGWLAGWPATHTPRPPPPPRAPPPPAPARTPAPGVPPPLEAGPSRPEAGPSLPEAGLSRSAPPRGRGGTLRGGRGSARCLRSCRRRVQLVRRDGRDVSTLYGREGGGGGCLRSCRRRPTPAAAPAPAARGRVSRAAGRARNTPGLGLPQVATCRGCVRLVRGEGRDVSS